jgi:deoxyadenosine/deoxycytidine kinase
MTPIQKQLRRALAGQWFIVEGNVGAGKTTLVEALDAYCVHTLQFGPKGTHVLKEDMPQLLLDYFIADQEHRAFSCQMIMKCKRFLAHLQADALCKNDIMVIADRSVTGNACFTRMLAQAGHIDATEMALYESEFRGDGTEKRPLVVIYLRESVDTLKDNIKHRNRPNEVKFYLEEDPTYLERLDRVYEELMVPERMGCPVIRVAWDRHQPLTPAALEALLVRVLIHEPQHLPLGMSMFGSATAPPPFVHSVSE